MFAQSDFFVQERLGTGLPYRVAIDGHIHGHRATDGFIAVDVDAGLAFPHGKCFEGGVLLGVAHGDGDAASQGGGEKNGNE